MPGTRFPSNHPETRIEVAVRAVGALPPPKAERALEALADEKGDRFVQQVLTAMPAVNVAAILRNHDEASPSIIHWLIPPKLAVAVLNAEPLFWENIGQDMTDDEMATVQNGAARFLFTMLLIAKGPGGRRGLLEAISEDDAALYYLYLPFFGWQPEEELNPFFENTDVVWGGCDHLFEKIRFASADAASQIVEYAASPPVSLKRHVIDLWQNAVSRVDTGRRYDPVEETMFKPVRRKLHSRPAQAATVR